MVKIGDVEVTRIEESLGPVFEPAFLFPDWRPSMLEAHRGWMQPTFLDPGTGRFISSVHSWVIKTAHHTVLVDACAGNDKQRPTFERFNMLSTSYLDRLKQAGVRPEDVDIVFCTHLHVDHAGWNTRLVDGKWRPTFPNAKYVFSKIEREFWDPGMGDGGKLAFNQNVFSDSVEPILDAGAAVIVDGSHQLLENMLIEPAPGHSPGHCIMTLTSRRESALFAGDTLHQPVQVFEPYLNSRFCLTPELARQSRRKVLEDCACTNAMLLPAHFGAPHMGRVRENKGQFSFVCESTIDR